MSADLLTTAPQGGVLSCLVSKRSLSRHGRFYLRREKVVREHYIDGVLHPMDWCLVTEVISFIPDEENNNE